MTYPAVSVQGLHVKLGGVPILHGIDLTIDAGATVAILGANGSGKSTLVKAIVGAIPASAGHIRLFGQPLGAKTAWHRIGYAPQRVAQAGTIPASAIETVISGFVHGWHFRLPPHAKARALQALQTVGLEHRANESVQTFSGGQQQRVLLARALVRDPDLLILDEPFAGIDSQSRENITQTLTHLKALGTTIVMVLHDIYNLDSIIDQVHEVSEGRLIHHRNHDVVMEHPSTLACQCEDNHA
ncbi:metal ABC transporter ATP-binding protein [Arcanobacterium pinnipediorum]|uniref:ATP-binding cassette domain-containing protein n=1 Tax=Arcanobacterium pinnipediorum TaxID=1503041 RepID=A0ABY5AJ95_9ACTO|nr:ATP-binding cassette domain-containing protein [Arcanobacterium pinnipediorum]USR80046.1 ATP-binding cassette domain-containing protein [Arcanobacterium pinnipediorum]